MGLSFEVCASEVDETPQLGESPEALVRRLSVAKALRGAEKRPEALVVAADTVVVLDGDILGKPQDEAENRAFLERLSNRAHEVFTGHALAYRGRLEQETRRTLVRFRDLSEDEVAVYARSGEGRDKAGGYAIQGLGGALVPHLEGCYFNVVGLSLATVVELAQRLGVRLV